MLDTTQSVVQISSWLAPGYPLFLFVHFLGVTSFAYIVGRRLVPLVRAQRDLRFDRPLERLGKLGKFFFGQWKHPRYRTAGILHIFIFTCFILLAMRAFTVLLIGVIPNFAILRGELGHIYEIATDYAATVVFLCMLFAIVRRTVFKPARYDVPAKFGKAHKADAIFLLSRIGLLMFADSLFEGESSRADASLTACAFFRGLLASVAIESRSGFGSGDDFSAPVLRRISASCGGLLFPALLSAIWNSVPRRDFAVQHLLLEAG